MSSEENIQATNQNDSIESAKDFLIKICDIKRALINDFHACDAKWTIFVSAALSYRYNSLLKPIPPTYLSSNGCNMDALAKTINDTTSFKILLRKLVEGNYDELDVNVIELLHWVLIENERYSLSTIEPEQFDEVLNKIHQVQKSARPTQIFEVILPDNSNAEKKFEKQREGLTTNFAFHGSKLEQFYSILQYGLNVHKSKTALFGDGIYLSSELGVSLNFSPNGIGWSDSKCGNIISCVALCEYVENPNYLRYHKKENTSNCPPETYYVITNNEIIRVRYILFFGNPKNQLNTRSLLSAWIYKNKYFICVCIYVFFLGTLGISNSGGGGYIKYLIKKYISSMIVTCKNIFTKS